MAILNHHPHLFHQVAKVSTAVTIGGSLLVLSNLTLAVTVIGLALATPLLVLFSPVLVPAAISACVVITGFLSSGGFGVAAVFVFSWMYKYVAGQHPIGADRLDRARAKLVGKAMAIKNRMGEFRQHQLEDA